MDEKLKILLDRLDADELTSVVREFFTEEQIRQCLVNTLTETDKEEILLNHE